MQPHAQDQQGNTEGRGFYPTNQSGYEGQELSQPQPQSKNATAAASDSISWEASEYVHHDKGLGWGVLLVIVALLLVGVAVWFGQWLFAVLLGVMAIAFGYFAFRKPRILRYQLSDKGLVIDNKPYPFTNFRAFGVLPDGAFYSIVLIPIQRFAPAVSVYFAEADGEKIVDILGAHLPMEQLHPDLIDTIMRKLRF